MRRISTAGWKRRQPSPADAARTFAAEYLKDDDLTQLAEGIPECIQAGVLWPVTDSMAVRLQDAPVQEAGGVIHFGLQVEQRLAHEIDLAHANALVRG